MCSQEYKKTILLDLDGVLNTYTGNFNKNKIPKINDGAKEFLEDLNEYFNVKIFTSRNMISVTKWLIENKIDNLISDITNTKELAWLYVDDRCVKFNGNYKDTINKILEFKPWYKKSSL